MSPGGLALLLAIVLALLAGLAFAYRVGYAAGRNAGDLDATREALAAAFDGVQRSRQAASDFSEADRALARTPGPGLVDRLFEPPEAAHPGPGPATGSTPGPAELPQA